MLETLTCGEGGNSEINKILLVPEKQQAVLQAYQMTVCGGRAEQRAELFGKLSEELRDQIDTQRVFDQVLARINRHNFVFAFNVPGVNFYKKNYLYMHMYK